MTVEKSSIYTFQQISNCSQCQTESNMGTPICLYILSNTSFRLPVSELSYLAPFKKTIFVGPAVNGLCTILPRKFRNFTKLVICHSDAFFSILVCKLSLLKDILSIRNTKLKKTKKKRRIIERSMGYSFRKFPKFYQTCYMLF